MNKVCLKGRLANDPEIRETNTGKKIARFRLAVDRKSARSEGNADFIPVEAWEKRAEFVERFLTKGKEILLEGRIQTGSYTKADGTKVSTFDVVAEDFEFCGPKGTTEAQKENAMPGELYKGEFMDVDDSELPFN